MEFKGEHQAPVVAERGAGPGRRRRPGLRGDPRPQVWEASGHLTAFSDPLTECRNCHRRFRADQLLEEYEEKKGRPGTLADVVCANCGTRGQFTEPRDFNGMLRTSIGPVEDDGALHYLRPETAQGIFVNFANVATAARRKPSFGIGQVGKSFRNEITLATSSSAPGSSSRWRWSSSSRPAPTRNGTSTGCSSAGTGTPTWA